MANPPQLLAVTVLTSMDAGAVEAAGLERSPAEQVELLARMGLEAGIRGFVCSPQEVAALRALTGPEGVLVVPGIRPAGAEIRRPEADCDAGGGAARGGELPGGGPADHAGGRSGGGGRGDSEGDGGGALRVLIQWAKPARRRDNDPFEGLLSDSR